MRRFSQRNSLVTLSDINITPMLDLAFVLLIIFVIISPSIKSSRENALDLTLPKGGRPEQKLDPKNIRTVEVVPSGGWRLDSRPMTESQVQAALKSESLRNPNLVVSFRAAAEEQLKRVTPMMTFFGNENIAFSLATEP